MVLVAIDESFPASTTVTINEWIFTHTGVEVDSTTIEFHVYERPPDLVWDKFVDGVPYDPDWVVSAEVSDTIEIVDVITTPPMEVAILEERWDPERLTLVGQPQIVPDPVSVDPVPGGIVIVLPEGSQTFVITKAFHVEPCMWQVTFIEEFLNTPGIPQPWILFS